MFVTLFDGPAAETDAPASLFAEGEGLIVIATLVPKPGGDMAVARRLAVYRTMGDYADVAVFAGWDDEIDREDEIAVELLADDLDENAAAREEDLTFAEDDGAFDAVDNDADESQEVVLRLVDRRRQQA